MDFAFRLLVEHEPERGMFIIRAFADMRFAATLSRLSPE